MMPPNPASPIYGSPREPSRMAHAARLVLDELSTHRRAEAELARRHATARDRGAALMRSLEVLLCGLAPDERAPLVAGLARIEGRDRPTPANQVGSSPATSAVLDFLAGIDGDIVTVPELNSHLQNLGIARNPRYAAATLNRMIEMGLVTRIKRAHYRINRYHPELTALRG